MRHPTSAHDITPKARAGALNLLENCVGVTAGQRVLIVGEDHEQAFFDPSVCDVVQRVAGELGTDAEVVLSPAAVGPEDFPECVATAMQTADHTIFLSRVGDQVRFCSLPGHGTKTMCYVHDLDYLSDDFSTTPHGLFAAVAERLLADIAASKTCRIICPKGTQLTGDLLPMTSDVDDKTQSFSVGLFPVMITPPISGAGLSGRLALGRWLTSSSTHAYENSLLELHQPVFARVEAGRVVAFEGDVAEVSRVDAHFNQVASVVGGDPYAVNSWHAGSYPKTFYAGDPADNIEKWSDLVYGSPRYTHFHVCGHHPGDIAISLIDATISFDGEMFWDQGRLVYLERDDIRRLLDDYPGHESAFDMRWDIGV